MKDIANEKWEKFTGELTTLQVALVDPKLTEAEEEAIHIKIKKLITGYKEATKQ